MPDPLSQDEQEFHSKLITETTADAMSCAYIVLGMWPNEFMRRQIAKHLGLTYAEYEAKRQFALRHAAGKRAGE